MQTNKSLFQEELFWENVWSTESSHHCKPASWYFSIPASIWGSCKPQAGLTLVGWKGIWYSNVKRHLVQNPGHDYYLKPSRKHSSFRWKKGFSLYPSMERHSYMHVFLGGYCGRLLEERTPTSSGRSPLWFFYCCQSQPSKHIQSRMHNQNFVLFNANASGQSLL